MLGRDVLDHQLVDVDGMQVIRAADLYLAPVLGRVRLVGVDVSNASLLRRLGPRRWRSRPTPEPGHRLGRHPALRGHLAGARSRSGCASSHEGLHRLRPGELADLLEELRRPERQELLAALSADEAADALEEMEAEDLTRLLRESEPADGRPTCWPRWSPTRRSTPSGTWTRTSGWPCWAACRRPRRPT